MTLTEAYHELNSRVKEFSEKAEKLFKANNWTWGDKIPNVKDIEITLGYLIWECYREIEKSGKEHACVGTGRLQVRFNKYSKWCGAMELISVCSRNY